MVETVSRESGEGGRGGLPPLEVVGGTEVGHGSHQQRQVVPVGEFVRRPLVPHQLRQKRTDALFDHTPAKQTGNGISRRHI